MDLCSLEDAFPNIGTGSIHKKEAEGSGSGSGSGSGTPFVGCTDNRPTREERRAARKKAKRCKGQIATAPPAEGFASTDPDRPAVKRLDPVEAINGGQARLYSPPVGQQPIGTLPKSTSLLTSCDDDDVPAYFGRGEEDPVEEGEGFADFAQASGDDATYRLVPDFTKVFDFKGLEKAAGGGSIPPELNDQWKPMESGATYTAFFTKPKINLKLPEIPDWSADSLRGDAAAAEEKRYLERWQKPAPGLSGAEIKGPSGASVPEDLGLPPVPSTPPASSAAKEREAMLARIDGLMNRLDALEKRHKGNNQNELLLFVGTGLFLLASFNLAARC
jgi:hypothetical protein